MSYKREDVYDERTRRMLHGTGAPYMVCDGPGCGRREDLEVGDINGEFIPVGWSMGAPLSDPDGRYRGQWRHFCQPGHAIDYAEAFVAEWVGRLLAGEGRPRRPEVASREKMRAR